MQVVWNSSFVVLSILVAIVGSFTALAHAKRMRESTGAIQKAWLVAGGVTLGMTVWAMHFIGMLAVHLPIPVSYDTFLTFNSILPAIAAALLGFYLLQSIQLKIRQIIIGGIFMGIGIAQMHYLGMAALKMQPAISYNSWIFALSVLIAIVAATGALLIVYFNERTKLPTFMQSFISAVIMGVAIAGMHYTGMAAASFAPNSICTTVKGLQIEPALLAMMITVGMLILFGGGWIANLYERREVLNQLRAANTKLALSDEELRIAASAFEVQEAVMITDANDIVLRTNQAFSQLTGYSAEEVVGKPADIFKSTQQDTAFFQSVRSALVQKKFWEGEIYDSRKDGSSYWKKLTINVVSNEAGETTHYVIAFTDVSEFKEAQENVQRLAFYDSLTNLPNRRLLLDRQKQAIAASIRDNNFGAVLFIDLDNFKTLNDTKGHAVGDLMLIEVAVRLQDSLRLHDTVARLGGDEFVVILEALGDDVEQANIEASQVAEKICKVLSEPYKLRSFEYLSSASIGISLFHGNSFTIDELFKRADSAMYQSKQAGRNTINFFDPALHEALKSSLAQEADLRQALAQHQFKLHYQMQVDSKLRIVGAEVLLRWHHPERGLIYPKDFIALAEDTGLIISIGRFVLETACKQLKEWQKSARTRKLQLAINISTRQFKQVDFVEQISKVLAQTGADPKLLKIELTESQLLDNTVDNIKKMKSLKALGVGFSMGDFGTGYSLLASLKRLPIDQLKIGRNFTNDIAADENDAAIVKTMVDMVKSLGLNVIAEGVETEEQLTQLKKFHCNAFQGYLFGKPVPLEQLELLLENTKQGKVASLSPALP